MKNCTPDFTVTNTCPQCGEPTEKSLECNIGKSSHNITIPTPCACQRKEQEEKERTGAERLKALQRDQELKDRENRNKFYEKHGLQTLYVDDGQSFKTWDASLCPNMRRAAMEFCEDIDFRMKSGIGLTLIGPRRHGKSFTLKAIYHNLRCEQGLAVAFLNQDDLLSAIKACFDNHEHSEEAVLDALENADVIILDELGVGKLTDWGRTVLYGVINRARTKRIPIVASSNLTEASLAKYFLDPELGEDRISPRIFEVCETIVADEHNFSDDVRKRTQKTLSERRRLNGGGAL